MEKLADAIENGTRDQQSDALVAILIVFKKKSLRLIKILFALIICSCNVWKVNDLNNHFEKCRQLLNSISGSLSSKAMVYWNSFFFFLSAQVLECSSCV